ncbi:MAG: hypothetical protein CXR30_18755 [Geobacter sp.]|nr:MAG: hypothetical protein CXR30_18755 [Geobacter sp.]
MFFRACVFVAILLLLIHTPTLAATRPLRITIQAAPDLLNSPVAGNAIKDVIALLGRSFTGAAIGFNKPADVLIELHLCRQSAKSATTSFKVPDASYCWRSKRSGPRIVLRLEATAPEGIASGLYGLLQEKLGIRFYHPRETFIPTYDKWPLPARFTFSGQPRFEKRGFHLHTLHPIELTEQLHNPAYPNAFGDIRAYLDWLARNGQNTFQFFLLRGVDRSTWPDHARRIVEYAHERGIRCGVEISLAMIQQQAFQAITLLRPWPPYDRQVDDTLAWLFRAPWDFITLEATMGEHLPFLGRLMPDVQRHLEREVALRYGSRLMYATHVIASDQGERVRRPLEPTSGILIHTVMCYSITEAKAPVYGNVNQRFMLEAARAGKGRRETWYWPESSYWVGFDTPVPMLLLPYLDARWTDMETMAGIGVNGHLTFTSGWEWGYWLMDWSIARWSWRLTDNGRVRPTSPLSRLGELLPDPELSRLWQEALELQDRYLKGRELLRYMAAMTPFSELPYPFDQPFQPDPGFSYAWLLHDAGQQEAAAVLAGPVHDLEAYAVAMEAVVNRLEARTELLRRRGKAAIFGNGLPDELTRGLRVTALRARHRALTLRALLAKREEGVSGTAKSIRSGQLLASARTVRLEAQQLVSRQEAGYRYPVPMIARRRSGMTAYPFGYLYPASVLFFWEREEEQVRRGRFDAFFMNLWDFRRTLGLESLIFKN